MSVLEQYTELKHLVRSHEQHAAEIKAIKATAAAEVLSARAEADGARAAMDAAMQELNKLKAEVAALRSKQRERKSAADKYHKHLEECSVCRSSPFDLCDTGFALLLDAAGRSSPSITNSAEPRSIIDAYADGM